MTLYYGTLWNGKQINGTIDQVRFIVINELLMQLRNVLKDKNNGFAKENFANDVEQIMQIYNASDYICETKLLKRLFKDLTKTTTEVLVDTGE